MRLKNKKILVLGLGESGRAVIKLCISKGAHVSFYDDNLKFYDYVGFERYPLEHRYDFVIVSPGIKVKGNTLLEKLKEKNKVVLSELDFAYLQSKGKIIGITGTNGKTTVSMLTAKILKEAGFKTFLCGNIGLPFSSVCTRTTKDSVVVCEVSNFQLETSKYFRPNIACILNIKPDHLDRHGSFEEYKSVKAKICQRQKGGDVLILNLDDDECKKMILHKKYQFFSKKTLKKGVFLKNNQIFVNRKSVLSVNDITLLGEKNLENVLASVAICSHFKVSNENFSYAVKNFSPASHRMELVGKIDGVTFIDDSKATNVASTVACVLAFKNKSIFLLLGGLGKEIEYDEIFSNFTFKEVVCFGAERENIFACAQKYKVKASRFEKFSDAVLYCKQNATLGDFVILSPACASFDEFSSYAQRGDVFKNLVLGTAE